MLILFEATVNVMMNVNLIYCMVVKVWSRFDNLADNLSITASDSASLDFLERFCRTMGTDVFRQSHALVPLSSVTLSPRGGLRLRPCKEGLRCAWNKPSRFGEQL